jgi:LDH2 family malate/lactate/ureidoglycolate dehydrogenase
MGYLYIEEPRLRSFGEAVFQAAGYTAEQSADIVDVLLTATSTGSSRMAYSG